MAASEKWETVKTLNPKDLWNRIHNRIDLAHPLLARDAEERSEVLGDYFTFFWTRSISKWNAVRTLDTAPGAERTHWQERARHECMCHLISYRSQFVSKLDGDTLPLASVRGLTTLIQRLASALMDECYYQGPSDEAREESFGVYLDQFLPEILPELSITKLMEDQGQF